MATSKTQSTATQDPEKDQTDSGAKTEQHPPEDQKKTAAKGADRKAVTFLLPFGRYTRGDVAGFEASEADRLVKKKVAVEGTKLPTETNGQDKEPKA